MMEILNLVVDGSITTREEAAAVVEHESRELAAADSNLSEAEARAQLLENIGYCSGYFSRGLAYRVLELFETQHPIFGPAPWPSPEEIFKMGMKAGERS